MERRGEVCLPTLNFHEDYPLIIPYDLEKQVVVMGKKVKYLLLEE